METSILLTSLQNYYADNKNASKLLEILKEENKISLRIIDWFVTNYSKKYFTLIKNGDIRFKVYIDYKLKLKAYSKKRFDPFCRWDRITIPYKSNSLMETTIGQLNFFKWVINNNIIEYIETHFDEINNDQFKRNSTSKNKLKSNNKTRKKREELSIFASKSIKKEKVKIVVEFK